MNLSRRFAMLAVLLMCVWPVQAQMQTLLSESVTHGVYVAPCIEASPFGQNGEWGFSPGVQIGWTLNQRYTIGFFANQLWNNVDATWLQKQSQYFLNVTRAGVFFSYTLNPDALVHAEFYAKIGAGLVGYRIQEIGDFDNFDDEFYLIEPGMAIEINVTRFMRTSLQMSYLSVQDIELQHMKNSDFSGLVFAMKFKVGLFR